jgi:tRNA pseudouridine55 synthase
VIRSGLIVVDKPSGMTSHDVVARIRRLAGTKKVGHAGTLDPMATGVLIIGVERATRLLTYLVGCDKRYAATIRFGQTTVTDDAEGETTTAAAPERLTPAALPDSAIAEVLARLTGEIDQVPSAVSAVKIRGVRSYARVRAGEAVELPARRVTIRALELRAVRRGDPGVDVEVIVECSSGTYVRAIARDAGQMLGVGGHLIALRRLAVGGFIDTEALGLADLAALPSPITIPLAEAAARVLPPRNATADEARILSHGGPLSPSGVAGPHAVFDPSGVLVAIVSDREGKARPEVVLAPT